MILSSDTFRTLNQLPAVMSRQLGATSTTRTICSNTANVNEYSDNFLLEKSKKHKIERMPVMSQPTHTDLR